MWRPVTLAALLLAALAWADPTRVGCGPGQAGCGPAIVQGLGAATTTPLASDDFESYTPGSIIGAPWSSFAGNICSTSQAHGGTRSMAIGHNGFGGNSMLPLSTATGNWTLDCWLWVNSVGGTTQWVGLSNSASGSGIVLQIDNTGSGRAGRPNVTGWVVFTVSTNAWHHYILTVLQNATGSAALTIDGVSQGAFSGDTRDSANNVTVNQVVVAGAGIGPSPDAEIYLDDLIVR